MAAKHNINADAEHPRGESMKTLRAQAANSGRAQRCATVFGQAPLAAAGPGWYLTQTLADHDEGAWQVTAPGGACAGYVSRSHCGAESWAAYPGDPADRNYKIRCILPAEGDLAAKNGEWATLKDAGLAIAHDYTQSGQPRIPDSLQ